MYFSGIIEGAYVYILPYGYFPGAFPTKRLLSLRQYFQSCMVGWHCFLFSLELLLKILILKPHEQPLPLPKIYTRRKQKGQMCLYYHDWEKMLYKFCIPEHLPFKVLKNGGKWTETTSLKENQLLNRHFTIKIPTTNLPTNYTAGSI